MTADLVAFLHARLDEDEQAARAAGDETGPRWEDNGFGVFILGTAQPIAVGRHGGCVPDDARAHIARHNPARVLAEVDAKRRIIEAHDYREPMEDSPTLGPAPAAEIAYCPICQVSECLTLRLLALPYADHPDYREEWRP